MLIMGFKTVYYVQEAELQYYRSGQPRPAADSISRDSAPPEFTPELPYQSQSYPDLTRYQSEVVKSPPQEDRSDLLMAALQKYLTQNKPSQPDLGERPKVDRLFLKDGSKKPPAGDSLTPVDGMTRLLPFPLKALHSHRNY